MNFGIIGYGNLGKALVRGLRFTSIEQENIIVNARTEKTRNSVHQEFPRIYVTADKKELVEKAEVLVIVVEPHNAPEVLAELGGYDINNKIVVSFMAGITRQEIKRMLGKSENSIQVIRVMPNLAIANGNGVLGITYDDCDSEVVQETVQVFRNLGYTLRLDEEQLDYITVTAASGLAFAAALMDSYQKACNQLFDDELQSKELTVRVFENVIDMIKKDGGSFNDMVNRIATKGGTTEAGMKCLEPEKITQCLEKCLEKSIERARNIYD